MQKGKTIGQRSKLDAIQKKPFTKKQILLYSQNFLTKSRKSLFSFGLVLRRGWKRNYVLFLGLSISLILAVSGFGLINRASTLKQQILGSATTGFDFLSSGRDQLLAQDYEGAAASFDFAFETFAKTEEDLASAGGVLNTLRSLVPQGQDVERLFSAASGISRALSTLTQGVKELEETRLVWDIEENKSGQDFYLSLKSSREKLLEASDEVSQAQSLLEEVNPNSIPESYRQQFIDSGVQLNAVASALKTAVDFQSLFLSLLGGREKTYLLLFQNNNEARATGGFIGTYGLLKFQNGQMNLELIESVYHLDGQLQVKNLEVPPPWPLRRLLTDTWGLRDSNWFVDFPTSSSKALEFLDQGSGRLADGVIAVTPDLVEGLLKLTGPVNVPGLEEPLTVANFRDVIQIKTSVDYDREENRPKKLLADFAPILLNKVQEFDEEQWLGAVNLISDMLYEKQLMLISLYTEIQETVEKYNAGGSVRATGGDYLMMVSSNVGGGKTNQAIRSRVNKTVSVGSDGRAQVTLEITRKHEGFKEAFFPTNVDFMRILVPAGSKLITADGFKQQSLGPEPSDLNHPDNDLAWWNNQLVRDEQTGMIIGAESGYTEFSGWLELEPGQQQTVTLTYELPFSVEETYTHLLQKQPGSREFDFTLSYHSGRKTIFTHPERAEINEDGVVISEVVKGDRFYAILDE